MKPSLMKFPRKRHLHLVFNKVITKITSSHTSPCLFHPNSQCTSRNWSTAALGPNIVDESSGKSPASTGSGHFTPVTDYSKAKRLTQDDLLRRFACSSLRTPALFLVVPACCTQSILVWVRTTRGVCPGPAHLHLWSHSAQKSLSVLALCLCRSQWWRCGTWRWRGEEHHPGWCRSICHGDQLLAGCLQGSEHVCKYLCSHGYIWNEVSTSGMKCQHLEWSVNM